MKERKQVECEKSLKEFMDRYGNKAKELTSTYKKPLFTNMHPARPQFDAIFATKGANTGFITFKNAKRVARLDKFNYRKFEKIDTVRANKKFFEINQHLKEFAKPYLPAGTASDVLY